MADATLKTILTNNPITTFDGTEAIYATQSPSGTAVDAAGLISAVKAYALATSTLTGHPTVEGVTSTGATGTGKFVFDGTPTLVTPVLGVATGTSLALGGATIGTNALAVTGTSLFTGAVKGTTTLQLGTVSVGTGQLLLANSASANLTTIQAGNAAAARTYTWPTNFGASGTVLTDAAGDGTLSWAAGGGGGLGGPTTTLGAADAASPVAQTLRVQSVVAGTTDTAGADFTITGSLSTGNATPGAIVFKVADWSNGSGSTQNSAVEVFRVSSAVATVNRCLLTMPNFSEIATGGTLYILDSSAVPSIGIGGNITLSKISLIQWSDNNNVIAGSADTFLHRAQANTLQTDGGMLVGSAAINTTATDGFLYIPTCAGTPTGTPTAFTGLIPMVYDTTNDKFWFYRSGWKQPKTPAGAAIVTWQ